MSRSIAVNLLFISSSWSAILIAVCMKMQIPVKMRKQSCFTEYILQNTLETEIWSGPFLPMKLNVCSLELFPKAVSSLLESFLKK